MRKLFTVLVVSTTPFIFNLSHAQQNTEQTGPTVSGAKLLIDAANVMNAATGQDSSTTQNLGSIESGNVSDITANVNAANAMNAATGDNTCADQSIGSIGHKTACERNK